MCYFEIQSQRILPRISLIHTDFKNQFAKIRGIRGGVFAFSLELASAKDVGNHQNISLDSLYLRIDNISAMTSTLFPIVIDNLRFRYRDR